ncbi:hypothetical protein BBJ28_00002841 [Nothophytophthora sp. Chile5]|nr:hypothetical protein BBJ28_00002841 [Nothophytophthora sp. Chile5]
MQTSSLAFSSMLLVASIMVVSAQQRCPPRVSEPIVATLDNGTLFSTCATEEMGVQIDVDSLFDVLAFADKDFLIFCRSSNCITPVRELVHSIPTDCLTTYHGSAHNLSDEVTALHHECLEVTTAADLADEDDVYRYFLD